LPGRWPIIVVDNGSNDETAAVIARNFPEITVLRSPGNLGAAGRNLPMAQLQTPYVAFCDDDTQWEPGALERAVEVLDAFERVGILSARVEIGSSRLPDPTCLEMAQSPLPRGDLPGPQLLGFMAGACIMRATAFRATGGYWPPFFIGGEEELMAYDVIAHGWRIVYVDDVVTRHFPSSIRDTRLRKRLLLRNAIWVAWMRRPWRSVGSETWRLLTLARAAHIFVPVLSSTLRGLPRALGRRKVISSDVEQMRRLLDK
jgi:GT2 family glycosyltransferase